VGKAFKFGIKHELNVVKTRKNTIQKSIEKYANSIKIPAAEKNHNGDFI
jgi:hypothetical protein